MNNDEAPETLPAMNTGLTGTPTAAGITWTDWTSAGTCSTGTDVIGPSTVQNCAAEFDEGVDTAAAMVSGDDWYANWDGAVGVGHRTSWPTVGARTEDISCDDVDEVDTAQCGCAAGVSAKCLMSFVCCWSSVNRKPPAAVAGINTPGDNCPGESTSIAAATDVDNLAYSINAQPNHKLTALLLAEQFYSQQFCPEVILFSSTRSGGKTTWLILMN